MITANPLIARLPSSIYSQITPATMRETLWANKPLRLRGAATTDFRDTWKQYREDWVAPTLRSIEREGLWRKKTTSLELDLETSQNYQFILEVVAEKDPAGGCFSRFLLSGSRPHLPRTVDYVGNQIHGFIHYISSQIEQALITSDPHSSERSKPLRDSFNIFHQTFYYFRHGKNELPGYEKFRNFVHRDNTHFTMLIPATTRGLVTYAHPDADPENAYYPDDIIVLAGTQLFSGSGTLHAVEARDMDKERFSLAYTC